MSELRALKSLLARQANNAQREGGGLSSPSFSIPKNRITTRINLFFLFQRARSERLKAKNLHIRKNEKGKKGNRYEKTDNGLFVGYRAV